MLYLVVFQLHGDEPTHTGFYEALERLGTAACVFDGAYLLDAGWTAYGVRKQLLPHLKPNDRLIVTKMYAHDCAGRLPKDLKAFIERTITDWVAPQPVIHLPPDSDILP